MYVFPQGKYFFRSSADLSLQSLVTVRLERRHKFYGSLLAAELFIQEAFTQRGEGLQRNWGH